jgi:hypothetical protein
MMLSRQEHMDALAIRMGRMLEGEDLFDIASICALLMAFAIIEGFDTAPSRLQAFDKVRDFALNKIIQAPVR